MKENNYEKLVYRIIWGVSITAFTAIGLYVGKFGIPIPLSSTGTIEQFGSFGDFIGGLINPLLQFIVIAMLFWSIQVQRQELKTSNEELKETKKEIASGNEAHKAQAELPQKAHYIKNSSSAISELLSESRVF